MELDGLLQQLRPFLRFVDIFVVAYLLYRIYMLLSRTRAMQLLIGFGFILILDLLARRLHLETLSWIITNVSSYLVFGLIVLLQPELRRLVSEIGRMPIFQWVNAPAVLPLDELTEAAISMARQKVGSIMILLREIRPQTIIDNAVRVDALITRELIETIFHKDTPLHDGAMMIENNRIIAASCYLPLSNSRLLKKTHGARHRAAMGISEETDAVIIVTSEETGKITLMSNGQMYTPIKPDELQLRIQELWVRSRRRKSAEKRAEKPEKAGQP
ncbi:MAG: diadenylate cyclase CdaA [Leptospiraceae bacterium]|nr:diadenylate cyclase CdaA [Leptospiraceae bacterium]